MQSLRDDLVAVRERAHAEIEDGRERAIVVRYIEDAICRLDGRLSRLPSVDERPTEDKYETSSRKEFFERFRR